MTMPLTPAEVFYSYADADDAFLEQLEKHLNGLQREQKISGWHRLHITASQDRKAELKSHLNAASLILLLISADFLASDEQYEGELQRALQRHDAHEAHVIPILLRSCEWEHSPFARLQIVPRNQKPIASWRDRDEAFTEVAREIRAALADLEQLSFAAPPMELPNIWQIPYQRNPVFTGREDLLQELHDLLQTEQTATLSQAQTQAISGLGGVGKTQLAVEYAYRTSAHYQAVFWVNGETQETLTSGYAGLAKDLNLPQKDEQDQQLIIQAVKRWLQTHRDWLLILDNVDNLTLLPPLLPQPYGGHILLTTRSQVSGRFAHHLDVSVLSNEEGALLLLRRAGVIGAQASLTEVDADTVRLARQISQELGDLPLALDQAGAYIEETGCSLLRYRQQYQQRRTALLARRGQLTTDYRQPVATTWSLSFEKVEQQAPLAAQILRLCSFLASDAIPEELVEYALASKVFSQNQTDEQEASSLSTAEQKTPQEKAEQEWDLDEVIVVLRAYSLIQRNPQESTLTMHRLVQAVLRDTLPEEERQTWAERTVSILRGKLPAPSFENWQTCERYVPHAQECLRLIVRRSVAQAHVLHWIGAYLLGRQRTREAGPYLQQALEFREQHLGKEHLETAASLDRLAYWWELQGRYADAEPLYLRSLTICEQQLGANHPDTATSLNNLAGLYRAQGRYADAEPLFLRSLAISEQQLGADHPDTATCLNNLAALYESQGRYADAEPLHLRALAISEQQLGADHPETAASLNNLAGLYESQGRYGEAEPLYLRSLAIREHQLGANHPVTATSFNNLAGLYESQSRYADAEPLYQRSLAIREQQLGADHPATATCLNNLAYLYKQQGRYGEAEPLYQRSLVIREQQLGADHPDTAASLNNLAILYYDQGRYEEAEPLLKRACIIRQQRLGKGHPDTQKALRSYAFLCQEMEQAAEVQRSEEVDR